ncbi:MAG: sulfatase-like hydrolase/transferase, partial [Verrucomicrobiota bacterium]
AKIDELGLRENTIVVFSSDHGPAPVLLGNKKESKEFSQNMLGYAGEFRGGKHNQLEGGVRVPFVIRWPGVVKAGHTDETSVISGIDWMPTLSKIAGVEGMPAQVDGEDISDIWAGTMRERTKPLFWKTSSPGSSPAMREGSWKLHLPAKRGSGIELYDLSSDPAESRNVADQHPEVVADLKAKVERWVAELPDSYDKTEGKKEQKKKMKKG